MYILLYLVTYLFLRTKVIEKWQMDILNRLYFIVADSYFIIHCAYYNKCKKTQDYVVIFIKEFTELKRNISLSFSLWLCHSVCNAAIDVFRS